jgi:beta-galactosidase
VRPAVRGDVRRARRRATKGGTSEFEGVYRDAMVHIDGDFAGRWADLYSTSHIQANPYLTYGG